MSGAIVVGDGDGPGNGAIVEPTPATAPSDPANLENASPVGATSEEAANVWPWLVAGVMGVAIGFGLASVAARRRSRTAGRPLGS
jgi:hypothetical protein